MMWPFQSHEQDVLPGVIDPGEQELFDHYNPDLPAFGTIGDDPASHGQAIAYLMRLRREAHEAREPALEQAERNARVYRHGRHEAPLGGEVVANEIQTAVLAISDIQTRDPLSVSIRPVQTREKPQTFWIGPPVDPQLAALTGLPIGLGMVPMIDPTTGQQAAQQSVDPMSGQPTAQPMMRAQAPDDPPQALDDVTAWQVRKLAAAAAFPAEWMFTLDDRSVADVFQTAFDLFWADCGGEDYKRENVLATNTYGYQPGSYGWDPDQKKHILRHVSIKEAFLDPKFMTIGQMGYCGFDIVMDVDEAKAAYPQLAPLIDEYAKIGLPSRFDSVTEFGIGDNRDFWRRTVTVTIFFLRNQLVPMTPQEAMDAGHVYMDEQGQFRSTQVQDQQPAQPTQQSDQDSQKPEDTGTEQLSGSNETAPTAAQGDDSEVDQAKPPAPGWPMTRGIRQITAIALTGRIAQDIRCEHWDIPMINNICIPLPSQPFGQGIPEKLEGMQEADNKILASVVGYAETFAHPGSAIPRSVANLLGDGVRRMHIDPQETLIIPDELAEKWGDKVVSWFVPPPLPEAIPAVMEMIGQRMKETSGHAEVLQGTPPSATSSGRMVEALQAGAAGQFGFQAQWTAHAVTRLANLMHYSHLWRLGVDDLCKIYKSVPPSIMQLVIERARQGKWDIRVESTNGASGERSRRLREALAMFQAVSAKTGEPVMPLKMVRDAANIDHEEAVIAFRQEMEQAMPPAMPAPQPQQQPIQPAPRPGGDAGQGI